MRFKDSVVQVVTNELSLDQVKEIAKDCGDANIFVERMKEFIKSS